MVSDCLAPSPAELSLQQDQRTLFTMRLLAQTLTLCLAVSFSLALPHHGGEHLPADEPPQELPPHHHSFHHGAVIDRCKGIEFDAVAVNEEGVPYFFKGDHLFKGFHGDADLSNETFAELDDHHHLGHVDAAFRMHSEDSPEHHDHQFFFLDTKVFSYYKHKLEPGYPKDISEMFPGIPDHLDAAVECPKPDCPTDTVIFFKADDIYHFDIKSKKVDEKEFKGMPNCTAAFRYMEHYYCLHGHQFSKFDPITGDVHGRYPKETRDYFMRCSHFGDKKVEDHIEREKCSRVHLDAITQEDDGDLYAFRGHHFISVTGDKFHSNTIESAFKELHSEVDAVFSYQDHLYMIKDNQVFVYKVGEPHTHLDGYPKPLKDELGIEGPVDAAFVCADKHIAHVIKGQTIYDVDLKATPRAPVKEGPLTHFKQIDTGMCGPKGLTIVIGSHFYQFESPMQMIASKAIPEKHNVAQELFGCDH